MSERFKMIFETWIITSLIAFVNLILAIAIHIATSTSFDFFTASNLMVPEFGIMLILGACLLARQPLEDSKRFDSDGNPTRAWKYALLGRKILLASVFLFAFTALFYVLGAVFPPTDIPPPP